MKATVSNRIYLRLDEGCKHDRFVCKELTYELPNFPSQFPLIIKNYSRITENVISLPRGRYDLIPEGYEIVDRRVEVPVELPKIKATLRPTQQGILDWFQEEALVGAAVGFGKTLVALGLAHKLQQKTLVVVTNTVLRAQWVTEVEKWFGFTPDMIGGGKKNISTPIVIGNIQTVNKFSAELSSEFGLIVIDEVHHAVATTFSNFINHSKAKYRLGLSGTLERKDGRHVMFKDYFGPHVITPKVENTVDPTIHTYITDVKLSSDQITPWATKVNNVYEQQEYQELVLTLAESYENLGHKVLVLNDRVKFLELLSSNHTNSVLITGTVDAKDMIAYREKAFDAIRSGESGCIYATQSIFSEGVSVNELSCVILATPINNDPLLIQIMGRVMRKAENKLPPIVVDIQLKGGTAFNQSRNRAKVYHEKGFRVKMYSLNKLAREVEETSLVDALSVKKSKNWLS